MNNELKKLENVIPKVDLSAHKSMALLIIDMQYHDASPERGLNPAWEAVAPGSMSYYNQRLSETTVPSISKLLEFFRSEKLQVVYLTLGSDYQDLRDCPPRFRDWTRNVERAIGLQDIWWTGNPDFAILDELRPAPGETVLRKTTNGGFNSSDLDKVLQWMGIDTLIITGVVTSACVETTARDAADRGYHCVIVDDATADYDPAMHDATLQAFELHFGRVVDGPEAIMEAVKAGTEV